MTDTDLALSVKQVRAARALLAWSQTDLARAAGVAASTVADFERGQRTPVPNNAQAMRDALEAEGVRFISGGVVSSEHLPVPPVEAAIGRPMRWITAADLAQWGERRDGQGGLPELISRLIYAARGRAARLRFPADESINYPGWDGVCDVDVGSTHIPAGRSAWEIGAQRARIGKKAQSDYVKRTADPRGLVPSETTFVFATPQRWPDKDVWVAERRAEGIWRDVRALDGDDFVHWVESYPGIGLRLAERLGRRPRGLRELCDVWAEWALVTKRPLSPDFVLLDRDEQATAALRWLRGTPALLSVQAEAADEAMAFLYAALQPLPDPDRIYWESRCVVAQSDEAARDLIGLGPKLVVILSGGDPGLAQRLVADGHHVFAAFGSDVGSPNNIVRLARPWRYSLEQGLTELDMSVEESHRLASTCGRSLVILRRLMPFSPGRPPGWAETASPSLIAAMLAGAWRHDFPADRRILEQLSGRPYETLESELTKYLAALDGPLRRSGEVWKLASLRDAWMLLAPSLTGAQLDRFARMFQGVLGAVDPQYDTDPNDQWRFHPETGERPSRELRRGLAEALIVLGVFPDRAINVPDAAQRAPAAVRRLLSSTDERVWWSLSGDFRRLAEAAPNVFLDCVDEALDAQPSPLRALFRTDEGFLSPAEYLSNLLWALETLAWSPLHLGQASLLLARLWQMDPGGRTVNRPSNSLRKIFLPWTPQTYATGAERLQVLDLILRDFPGIGWQTLLSLAPRRHDTSFPSPLPVWRDFTVGEHEAIIWANLAKMHMEIGKRVLHEVGNDPERWTELLDFWANFDSAWRTEAVTKLSAAIDTFPEPARDAFREALRSLLHKHEAFPDADWSMEKDDLEPLRHIFKRLEPGSVAARYAWLFNSSSAHFQPGRPWEETQQEMEAAQAKAAGEILTALGIEGALAFARTVRMTKPLGIAFAAADVPAERRLALLWAALEDPGDNSGNLALGMLSKFAQQHAGGWTDCQFDAAAAAGHELHVLLRIALALNSCPDAWRRIEAAGAELERRYWSILGEWRIRLDDLVLGCEKLMAVGRARSALNLVGQHIQVPLPAELLIRILEAAAAMPTDDDGHPDRDTTMFGYYVARTFRRLDQDPTVSESDLVRLEWTYFHLLRHSERPPRTLHKAMATDPEFFVQMLSAIYLPSPDSGVAEPELDRERAEKMATQAFHVLDDWARIPGSADNGEIDGAALETWVKTARQLCAKVGRAQIGEQRIGEVLSAATRQPGEAWPPEPIREVIEFCRSRDLEVGFEMGLYNRRGVTVRMPHDGGAQERALAAVYRADARACAFQWQRTRAVLERIAESYERDGMREDQRAEQRDW